MRARNGWIHRCWLMAAALLAGCPQTRIEVPADLIATPVNLQVVEQPYPLDKGRVRYCGPFISRRQAVRNRACESFRFSEGLRRTESGRGVGRAGVRRRRRPLLPRLSALSTLRSAPRRSAGGCTPARSRAPRT